MKPTGCANSWVGPEKVPERTPFVPNSTQSRLDLDWAAQAATPSPSTVAAPQVAPGLSTAKVTAARGEPGSSPAQSFGGGPASVPPSGATMPPPPWLWPGSLADPPHATAHNTPAAN